MNRLKQPIFLTDYLLLYLKLKLKYKLFRFCNSKVFFEICFEENQSFAKKPQFDSCSNAIIINRENKIKMNKI